MSETTIDYTKLTDAAGRVIELKPLSPSEQFKLVKVLGQDSKNEVYMSMALMAASVRTLAGIPCPYPRKEDDIGQILDKLGDAGLEAIQKHLTPAGNEGADPVAEVMDSAKN